MAKAKTTKSPPKAAARNTDSGPAAIEPGGDLASDKALQVEELVAAMPYNPNKDGEHGFTLGASPRVGASAEPASRIALGSTLSEEGGSLKTGTVALSGTNATIGPLDRVRVDSSGRALTTNQGVPVADNQNSLKYGLRGPV